MICPFCDKNELEYRLIHKDELAMAFTTNLPIMPGHTLICPVRHIATIDELFDEELLAIKNLIIRIKKSLRKSFSAEGFNLASNQGEPAGQTVSHLHFHLVPRKDGDSGVYGYEPRKFFYRPGSRNISPEKELREVAEKIRENLE